MGRRWITIEQDIDLSDYTEEFLELMTNDELIDELNERNLSIPTIISKDISISTFRDHLCDLLNTGYLLHNDDEIIEMIKQKLKN